MRREDSVSLQGRATAKSDLRPYAAGPTDAAGDVVRCGLDGVLWASKMDVLAVERNGLGERASLTDQPCRLPTATHVIALYGFSENDNCHTNARG